MQYLKALGHWSKLGEYRQLPKLKLHSTMNTIVTCPVCQGGGVNTTTQSNGMTFLILCPHCKGKKIYRNKVN